MPVMERLAEVAPARALVQTRQIDLFYVPKAKIVAAFQKYAVPLSSQILSTPTAQRGYILLQLATEVLAKNLPNVATKVLNAAVQLAVTGSQA